MKSIYKLSFIISIMAIVSCNHNNPNEDKFGANPDSGWVNFSLEEDETLETIGVSQVGRSLPVILNSPVTDNTIGITYQIEAAEGSEEVPAEVLGTFTDEDAILVGETTGNIDVSLATVGSGECYTINVTIIGTTENDISAGLDDLDAKYPVTRTVEIGSVAASYSGQTFFQGSPVTSFTPTLTPIEGEIGSYNIDTAWGETLIEDATGNPNAENLPYDGILTINPDGTVTITGNEDYATGGSGVINPCEGTITYTLTQAAINPQEATFDVVLTAQ